MADRQDIDALMIGALYGELDAAESARLDAHLSRHPEDRAAMDGLTRTRATLRENLDAMPAAEPPQAISAVLLQAAARQAPARRAAVEPSSSGPGLWTRFVEGLRSFAMNPAFAGAAALLLVGGAATLLFVRSGDKAAEPVKNEGAVARNEERVEDGAFRYRAEPDPAAPAPAPAATGTLDLKESINADLDQQQLDRGGGGGGADEARATVTDKRENLAMAPERAAGGKAAKPKPSKGGGSGYASIDTSDVAPPVKDPFADPEGDADAADDSTGEETKAAEGRARDAARATARAPEPKPADPALEDWAKREHGRLVKLVRDGKCPEAGRVGAEIKDRAPEYYAAYVANDRAIRSCKQYIEGQAKKKADKDYKSRSQGNAVDLEATE